MQNQLPSGTVTFLFTDIEGSTQLWEQHPEAMQAALARHDALLHAAIGDHHGQVVKSTGDGLYAVFASATDGVNAVVASQRALQAEAWPVIGPLRVRMALHTGEAELREGDYFGPALNRTQRLMAVGAGGQCLLSQAATAVIYDQLPAQVSLRDLGEHRLKDLVRPEHVYQVVATDLPADFPPLKSLSAYAHNLPVQLTSLVGREQEIDETRRLLGATHLLTLTGPGGAGKTRLALQLAAEVLPDFPDGVYVVFLAPIREPDLVITAVAQELGVREVGGQPLRESLKEHLRGRQMLLMLDNFEQILPAAPLVGELLAGSPRLKVLVTSREMLHLYGEQEYPTPPLALPDPKPRGVADPNYLSNLAQSPAVTLFVQRAGSAKPGFALNATNAAVVAEICIRLDGLPLAIELAAARTKLFSPEEMLARLESRFQWLTSGARDLAAHQQTLQSTLDWSYNLLAAGEQTLLRRLGVFVGGCSLAAIETVCDGTGDLPMEVLAGVASLLDKSLVQRQEGSGAEPRFGMLETIRVYAQAKLLESEESESIRSSHLTFYLNLAELAASKSWSPEPRLLDQLEQEHDNLRAALQWVREQEDIEKLALLALALSIFWYIRGYTGEQMQWLEVVLAQRQRLPADTQAEILTTYGETVFLQGEYERAKQILEEVLALWRALDNPTGQAVALCQWGELVQYQGDYVQAEALWAEGLMLYRKVGWKDETGWALSGLGNVVRLQGDYTRAAALLEEALVLFRELEDRHNGGWSLTRLGQIRLAQGHYPQATALLQESLTLHRAISHSYGLAVSLGVLGSVSLAQQQPERATRLFGAAQTLLSDLGPATHRPMDPKDKTEYDRNVATARAQLDDERFSVAWAEGHAMTVEQAVEFAVTG